jgi:hypothetical protein
MIPGMNNAPANQLCQACGLCCNGQLFIWVKLRPAELDPAEALGMTVLRDNPNERGFNQPCPLWKNICTIYTSQHYPRACRAYKCKLLKDLMSETVSLPQALTVIRQAQTLIGDLETLLPPSLHPNFRERFVAQIENPATPAGPGFDEKAAALLGFYADHFGVTDLL